MPTVGPVTTIGPTGGPTADTTVRSTSGTAVGATVDSADIDSADIDSADIEAIIEEVG